MPRFLRQTVSVIRKDLRREMRTGEILTTTVSFSVLLMVIFTFAFYQDDETVAFVFPGILWVAVVFAGTLVISRTFAQETEAGCLRALALVPGAGPSLYVAKMAVNLLFMAVFEAVLLPLLTLAFNVELAAHIGSYAAVLAAGTVGFVALGTLVSAMLVHNRLRDVLLPLVLYPLAVPLLISGVKATSALMVGPDAPTPWGWVRVMCAMDVVFVAVGYYLFDSVLDAVE